jgi:DNA-binding SARP family transcriptional activator
MPTRNPSSVPTTEPTRETPELFLLGGIALRGTPDGVADKLLAHSKVLALLAYLVLAPPGRYQRRDRLVNLLWPELDQEHARAALRKAVFAIRRALGPNAVLSRGDEEIALASGALWCDVVEFNTRADAGHLVRAFECCPEGAELLAGFHLSECNDFDQWLSAEREQFRERVAATAWALAVELGESGKHTTAGKWARRAVRYAGTDERVLRRVLNMLEKIGDRAGAVRVYEDFTRRLREELEVEPSGESQALAARLRGSVT